jgi:GTP-binding protein HflX
MRTLRISCLRPWTRLTRRLYLPASKRQAVVSDTVGFIRHLPHGLVAAFRATLEETVQADLLLHVIDSANPEHEEQISQVNSVLAEIGADQVPQLLVYNKIDAESRLSPSVVRDECGKICAVRVSALTGAGIPLIAQAVDELLNAPAAEAGSVEEQGAVAAVAVHR